MLSQRIIFWIDATPVAQPRVKAASRGGHSMVYTPRGKVDTFKAAAQFAARSAYQGKPMDCPLRVDVEFVFPRPKSILWKTKPMPRLRHCKKPDTDNLQKALFDALNELIWRDDALICDGRSQKFIAAGDEQPGVRVVVTPLDVELDACD